MNGWLVPPDFVPEDPQFGLWTMVGLYWRDHRCYRIESTLTCTHVSCQDHRTKTDFWTVHFDQSIMRHFCYNQEESMASKWISAAIKVAEKRVEISTSDEPTLWKNRPALRDFMTCLEGAKDVAREPSVIMIAVSEMGIRAGLKDDTAGGWLWREGLTLEDALNAIEKALQSGSPSFTSQGGRRGRRR